ncbi:hypothetical protein [Mammaliicoccus lentus]|uniref:Lipoprotein n=1 Tax=Mammaliicoccus lentus TaxID=42858 RepID=A0ABS6GSX5_MAMLE|nr:hypothetical protein [Mammaliicoccus lentus]MBU6112444.1 hypothetical protein [Mammaliicoccus lentus]
MKKLLFLLFASLLVLGACGQKGETISKEESTKKTESKDKKKDNDKKDKSEKEDKESAKESEAKTEEKSTEENTTERPQSTEEDTAEEQINEEASQQEQAPTKEEMEQKFKNGEDLNGQVDNEGNEYVQAQGNGDAMGYYKPDGSYCTVGGCLTPDEMEEQEEHNYQAMEEEGISREEYDEIKAKEAELTRQRDAGEITSEEYTEALWELY